MKYEYGNDFPKADEYCECKKCDDGCVDKHEEHHHELARLDVSFLRRVFVAIAVLVALIFLGQVLFDH